MGLTFGWLCNHDPHTTPGGGAEMSDKLTILEGLRRGHDVRVILPPQGDGPQAVNVLGCDATVVSNSFFFPPEIIEMLVTRNKTIFYLHDYAPTCKYKLFYPLADRCLNRCPVSTYASTLLSKAALLVWLSPLHRAAWLRKHPELECVPHHLHPSPIDLAPFEEAEKRVQKKPGTVIGVNALAPYKGGENVLKYAGEHPELQFTFIGGPEEGVKLPDNCRAVDRVDYGRMPGLLARHEYAILRPRSPQPYERFPVEARAAGCKVLLNDLVGCTSYPFWPDWAATKTATRESPGKFWDAVEAVV